MITAEDLALAQRLLSEGKVEAAVLEAAIASLGAENQGRRLGEVLRERGLMPSPPGLDATVAPPGGGAPAAASPPALDATVVPAGAPGAAPAASPTEKTRVPGVRATEKKTLGRYEIIEEVARGGMGIVYRAYEPALNRHVALKVLLSGQGATPEQIERFDREARAAAALQHPNIVRVFEVGEQDSRRFMAMEFVEGTALDRLVRRDGPLHPRTALRIARDIARALQYAHGRGIVHRDIKPGNILVASAGRDAGVSGASTSGGTALRVLLGDFGLARDTAAPSSLTVSGNLIGTPAYMSPEQAGGRVGAIDGRSDVFSLGAVLFELLTGRQPFRGDGLGDVLSAIMNTDVPSLRALRPGLHRDIEVIVHKAMAREPAGRYQTAGDLAEDIDRYLNGEAILAEAPGFAYRIARWVRAHAAAAAAAAAILLSLAAAGGFFARREVLRRRDAAANASRLAAERLAEVEQRLAEASAFAAKGDFREAELRLETARTLLPGHAATESVARDVRLQRALARIGALVTLPSPRPEDWETARALIGANAEFRDHPEIRRFARLAEGTCSWGVDSSLAGVQVDLGPVEPGVYWDEETFPALEAARAAGLCAPAGTAPLSVRDIPFGDHLVVFSRGGRVERAFPIHLERSSTLVLEHAVYRVGSSEVATHRRLEDVLQKVRPGATILLESAPHSAGNFELPAGLLIRSVPGARAELSGARGSALPASAAHGLHAFDLDLRSAGQHGASFDSAARPTLVRCRVLEAADQAVALGGSRDWHLREVEARGSVGFALFASHTERGLAVSCTFVNGTWATASLGANDVRFLRCRFERGQRAGLFLVGQRNRVEECEFHGCPEWGIILEGGPGGAVVRDTLFVNCATTCTSNNPGSLLVSGGRAPRIEHNTIVGGAAGGVWTDAAAPYVRDNIVAGVRPWRSPATGGEIPGAAIILRAAAEPPDLDGNLIWDCTLAGSLARKPCATLADFARVAREDLGQEWRLMARGAWADPGFRDPGKGDWRLGEGSPARAAATDGGDIGVRWGMLDADRLSPAARVVRENGRAYLARACAALELGDRERAAKLLPAARLLAPEEPGLPAAEAALNAR